LKFFIQTGNKPESTDKEKIEKPIQQNNRTRERRSLGEENKTHRGQRGQGNRFKYGENFIDAGIPPDSSVEAEEPVKNEFNGYKKDGNPLVSQEIIRAQKAGKANPKGKNYCRINQDNIGK